MNILNKLEEGNIYEVLIATENGDGTLNIKPFGVKFEEQHFVLHLFPNKTLFNIKQKKSFTVYFTNDVLAYTNALFGLLDDFDKDFAVECEVENIVIMGDYAPEVIRKVDKNNREDKVVKTEKLYRDTYKKH